MFGMFGIGSPFFSSICFGGGFGFIERGVDLRCDVISGLWRGAMALCNGVGSMPYGSPQGCRNYIGNLIDWRRACVARSRAAKKGKDLPPGADSPSHGTRGRSYLNQFFYNGPLKESVDQEAVIKSILGPNASAADKGALRKKDNILRVVVEKVVGGWLNNAEARGQFLRKREMAKNENDRALALLDPMGDGTYLKLLVGTCPGLDAQVIDNNKVQAAHYVLTWLGSELKENGVLDSLGAEALNIVRANGWQGDTILDQQTYAGKSKSDYISALVDKGYTNEEAKAIMSPGDMTGAEAEEMMRNMQENAPNMRNLTQQLDSQNAELKRLEAKRDSLKKDEEKKQYQDSIDRTKFEIENLQRERAKRFLSDYMKVAKARFGKTAQDFGYEAGKLPEGVTDVPHAIQWVYGKLGRDFVMPEAPVQDGTVDKAEASPTPSGNKGGGNTLPTKTVEGTKDQASGRTFYKLEKPFYGYKKDDPSKTKRPFQYALKKDDNEKGKVTHYCESVDISTCVPSDQVTRAPVSEPQITGKTRLTPPVQYKGITYNYEFTFKDEFGEVDTRYSPDEPVLTEESAKTWVKKSEVDAAEAKKAEDERFEQEIKAAIKADAKDKPAGSYPNRGITVRNVTFIVDYQVNDDGSVEIKKLIDPRNNKNHTSWVNK